VIRHPLAEVLRREWTDHLLAQNQEARLIALDWGTTSLRAYLLGDSGTTLEERSLPLGIMRLHEEIEKSTARVSEVFERAFEQACGDWAGSLPAVPIVAAGMVGSVNGWREAPYLSVPFDLGRLGAELTPVRTARGNLIHIVPGLLQTAALGNVMRGEETQVLGALTACDLVKCERDYLFGLPGTHSKWIRVFGRYIRHFETFMTGEVYSALCAHTILGRGMRFGSQPDLLAFDRGVQVAGSAAGKAGILSSIFSVRTLGIMGGLSPEGLSRLHGEQPPLAKVLSEAIVLVGEDSLCARYLRALKLYGHKDVQIVANATQRGLWEIALQAGLILPKQIAPPKKTEGPLPC
jgi:2-dehydro-3-deoxygalactonokinase